MAKSFGYILGSRSACSISILRFKAESYCDGDRLVLWRRPYPVISLYSKRYL